MCGFQQRLLSQKQLRNISLEYPGVNGKTRLNEALVRKLQRKRPVGGVDADGMRLKWIFKINRL
jgi:hypothetical protein